MATKPRPKTAIEMMCGQIAGEAAPDFTKPSPKPKKVKPAPKQAFAARRKVDAAGIDWVCEQIGNGVSVQKIAQQLGVSLHTVIRWLSDDPTRLARVREVRTAMAQYWDEKAEAVLANAHSKFELSKANSLAFHYRWRAAKVAPRDYGTTTSTTVSDANGSVTVQIVRHGDDDDGSVSE